MAKRSRLPAKEATSLEDYQLWANNHKDWTAKQRLFFKNLVHTQCPTEAALLSFDCKDRKSAGAMGGEYLKKLGIGMSELLDYVGLNAEQDARDLARLRKAKKVSYFAYEGEVISKRVDEDNVIQIKALELTQKIKGTIRETAPVTVNVDNSKHVHYTKIELKDKDPKELTEILLARTSGRQTVSR